MGYMRVIIMNFSTRGVHGCSFLCNPHMCIGVIIMPFPQVKGVIGWLSTKLPANLLQFIAATLQPVSDQLQLTLNEIRIMPNPSRRLPNERRDLTRITLSTNAN